VPIDESLLEPVGIDESLLEPVDVETVFGGQPAFGVTQPGYFQPDVLPPTAPTTGPFAVGTPPPQQYSPELVAAAQAGVRAPVWPSLQPVTTEEELTPRFRVEAPPGLPSFEESRSARGVGGTALGLAQEFAMLSPEEQMVRREEAAAEMFGSVFGPHAKKWWGDLTEDKLRSLGDYLNSDSSTARTIRGMFPGVAEVAGTEAFPKAAAGAVESVAGLGEFATSPAGIYTAVASRVPGGGRLVAALFLADTARNFPAAGKEIGEALERDDWRHATEVALSTVGVAGLTLKGTTYGGLPAVRRELRQWVSVPPPDIPRRVTPPGEPLPRIVLPPEGYVPPEQFVSRPRGVRPARPVVPATPAEPREPVLAEIRRVQATTIREI